MTVDELISLLRDILIPSAAILVSVAIAIALARSERRAGAAARHAENLGRVGEQIVEALVPFISLDPVGEVWAPYLRTLQARVLSFQIIAQSPAEAEVGAWLAIERDRGARIMHNAMLEIDKLGGAEAPMQARIDEMASVRNWADLVTKLFTAFLIDPDQIEAVRARVKSKEVEWNGRFGQAD